MMMCRRASIFMQTTTVSATIACGCRIRKNYSDRQVQSSPYCRSPPPTYPIHLYPQACTNSRIQVGQLLQEKHPRRRKRKEWLRPSCTTSGFLVISSAWRLNRMWTWQVRRK
ncbi:unnamed protein product [Victoria cruziana]